MDAILALLAALLGVLVGGLINVLADDLPGRGRLRAPHYPDGAPRPVSAWLGLTAFLTGQRHPPANPAARLSWRHPLVELATALAFAALAQWYADEPGVWAWFVYVAVLLLITVIDVEHRLILFVVVIPASVFALIVAAISPPHDKTFWDFALGGAIGFGVFFLMFLGGLVFNTLTHNPEVAFGFGDVMLATLSGLILGWQAFIFATFITVIAGALGAVVYILGRALIGRRYAWFTPLPYGPYIVIGTLALLLFSEQLQKYVWSTY